MSSPPTTATQFEQTRQEISTGSGVKIVHIDFTPEHPCVVTSAAPPCLAVCVFLQGEGESVMADQTRIRYAPDQALLYYAPRPSQSQTRVPGRQQLRAVEILFTAQVLEQIQDMQIQPMLQTLAARASTRPAGADSFVYQTPASAALRAIAEQIFRTRAPDGVQQLFLHSKALELLSLLVEALLAEPVQADAPAVQRRDQKKLGHARDCLLARLDHNWSLAELAHTASLNERKLKEGFKALFGSSVHAYLQEKRMQAAATLLSETNLSITEVVMQTGYANPSHFSKLFRRHFGMTPREFIQANSS
ncbi:AraC family transcriptional regulator [Massilia sp. erpn]|uniref:helix-turn-helix domain-containing protein n=1 Tax=Massilia sp. erpn TaxID=2738142 RepID=UPI002105590D|nr:AraC family transcriptional regulator [Massilia sp. erpn]UTY58988.1 helix-turn-helix domain-containing protein [Massilia sp. erpn]